MIMASYLGTFLAFQQKVSETCMMHLSTLSAYFVSMKTVSIENDIVVQINSMLKTKLQLYFINNILIIHFPIVLNDDIKVGPDINLHIHYFMSE